MSNYEPYPDLQSEATRHIIVADKVRQLGVTAAAISMLAAVGEISYKVVEQLPEPTEMDSELKYSLAAMAVSTVVALGSAGYQKFVRYRYGLKPQTLKTDKLSILESTER